MDRPFQIIKVNLLDGESYKELYFYKSYTFKEL